MINKILRLLLRIRNFDRIPKLPRGMLAEKYPRMGRQEERVLARLGARSPNGIRVAMKRAGVKTIPELVEQLEHFRARREVGKRFLKMVGRAFGGLSYNPHQQDLIRDARRSRQSKSRVEIDQRLERAARAFKHIDN